MFGNINVKALADLYKISESDMQLVLENKLDIEQAQRQTPPPSTATDPAATLPFFQQNKVTIYNEDFVLTQRLAPDSIDLVVTSPPYNVGIEYGSHDDETDYSHYLEFSRQWLQKCFEVAKPDGRLCMNIPLDKNKGGQQSICADITTIAKAIGWNYHSTIIWNEGNISRRTAWGSWLSASAPYVIAPVEVIVVMYKAHWKKQHRAGRVTGISKEEFMAWTNGVWSFNGESKKRIGHPAPFPRELPKRCIKLFSFEGDIVLDPFLGSGTTLIEALSNNRYGIGFDIDETYCQLAKKRLQEEWLNQPKLL